MVAHIWIFYAVGAAFVWGFTYAVSDKLMREGMSPSFMLFISAAISFPFYLYLSHRLGTLKAGLDAFTSNSGTLLWTLAMALGLVLANYLIVMSVYAKNATLAALIEISYPVFTIFFAWLIMRELQVNIFTAIGGLLIFCGIATIYLKG